MILTMSTCKSQVLYSNWVCMKYFFFVFYPVVNFRTSSSANTTPTSQHSRSRSFILVFQILFQQIYTIKKSSSMNCLCCNTKSSKERYLLEIGSLLQILSSWHLHDIQKAWNLLCYSKSNTCQPYLRCK